MRRDEKGRILREPRMWKFCLICGEPFFIRHKRMRAKYCSKKCQGKFYSGKNNYFHGKTIIRTPEIKQIIKEKMSGANNHNWTGGKNFKNECKQCGEAFFTYPSQSKLFCSKLCLGDWLSKNRRGENHPCWQGGLTPEVLKRVNSEAWRTLRKEIYKRDNYTCQICGNKNIRLNAHHIVPFQYSLCDKSLNLITLCQPCHGKEDSLFKRKNEELYYLLNQWKAIRREFPEYRNKELF